MSRDPLAARSPTLRLHLRWVGGDLVRIYWLDENNNDLNYDLSYRAVRSDASAVRSQLKGLLQAFMYDPRSEKTCELLRGLFKLGNRLFETLFAPVNGDRETARDARAFYNDSDSRGHLAVQMKVDPQLTLPWGLMVPALAGAAEASREPTVPNRLFWALRHDLSVATFGAYGNWGDALGAHEVCLVAAIHRRILESALGHPLTAFEARIIEVLHERACHGLVFDEPGLTEALRETGRDESARLRVAYLLGHGTEQRFQFEENDQMTASSLVSQILSVDGRTRRLPTLLFLNACKTAADAPEFSFTDLLEYKAVCAFIGTEVEVPDLFAVRYSLALLHAVLVEGRSLREAVSTLRRAHLPLSLVYSVYAPDNLAIRPSPDPRLDQLPPADRPSGNLSLGPLKCTA